MWKCLWAKTSPYQSLSDHMIETGRCAQAILVHSSLHSLLPKLSSWLNMDENAALGFAGYIVSLHDIGKCHPWFQAKDLSVPGIEELTENGLLHNEPKDKTIKFRHEKYTGAVLRRIFKEQIGENDDLWNGLIAALVLHHQGKSGENVSDIPASSGKAGWEKMQDELSREMRNIFRPVFPKNAAEDVLDVLATVFTGLTILSDWIASDFSDWNEAFDPIRKLEIRGLVSGKELPRSTDFCQIWPWFKREKLRGIQAGAELLGDAPAPFYIVEAPMGEGKTEAAIYLAARQADVLGKDGFYIALPTSATGNQMYRRVNEWFSSHNMGKSRLLHSTAWMIDDHTPDGKKEGAEDNSSQWLAPLRRGLLEQYAVGTIDQAMLSVMNAKYSVLRLFGLSGKILVLDEIHAYDVYMQTIIERLISWCRVLEIPVVMLSATLPSAKKRALIKAFSKETSSENTEFLDSYPLITSVDYAGKVAQHPVKSVHMHRRFEISLEPYFSDNERIAEIAVKEAKSGGCICVLLNTVAKAQNVYRILRGQIDPGEVDLMLFHARFPAEERKRIEDECVGKYGKDFSKRPETGILVATQVMEQSIDADFDVMITDMAPIDLVLQRIGRLHRFDNTVRPSGKENPRVIVLTCPDGYEKSQFIYAPLIMSRTEELLLGLPHINTPEDIRSCVETVYSSECPKDESALRSWAEYHFSQQLDHAKAEGVLIPAPNYEYPTIADSLPELWRDDDECSRCAARTRLGEESTRIILLPEAKLRGLPESPDKKTAKELLLRSVSIRTTRFGTAPDNAVAGTGLLKGYILLPEDENGIARWNEYRIFNDPELGTIVKKEE